MTTLSVVLSVFNEEKKLGKTLSAVSWADEIVVVDNTSTDRTVKIASGFKAKIYKRPNYPMLNTNKNYGISQATGDWILYLDADEVVSQELATEVKRAISNQRDLNGFWIPRKNIIFGKWIRHGLWWPDKQLRLFKHGSGRYPEKHVHEYITLDGKSGELSEALIHYNYESVTQYLHKFIQIYADNEAENLASAQYRYSWYDAIRFPVSDFVKIYFAQKAYQDGLHGLVLSIFQAFYSFVVFTKLWERNAFREIDISPENVRAEINRSVGEIIYWNLTTAQNHAQGFLAKLFWRLKRKFVRIRPQ
ncbi:hypothetical protein A2154_03620 [Candidatus Gottesmanbacteria bacterium RBG_16_43_7]|uniref:Glycosyltransferase 2-like domain-containing protein n=1 Tax=Candidatus Gottesmanbacteria bacterium RBG_16_43_7 TaxID=1798373 RepID=A0A1F5Z7B9_9BACT|nr:MAG: hypothetical protein A2154_03620 [Candidatus Gottesmanbacteria bacterium RBG_16_43_7]